MAAQEWNHISGRQGIVVVIIEIIAITTISIVSSFSHSPLVSHTLAVHIGAHISSRTHPNSDMRVPLFEQESDRITHTANIIIVRLYILGTGLEYRGDSHLGVQEVAVDTPKRQTPRQHFNRSERCLTCRYFLKTSQRQADDQFLPIPKGQSSNLDPTDPIKQTVGQSYL